MQAALNLSSPCRNRCGRGWSWWQFWRSGETTERRKEERSAFRTGSGHRIWFFLFQIPGAPSTAAARDSVGHLLHHRSTLGGGVKNGEVVRSFGGKGLVLRFSDSVRRKVPCPRSCQPVMCALPWYAVRLYIPAPAVIPRWWSHTPSDVMSCCSGHVSAVKVRLFSTESFRLSGYRSKAVALMKLKQVTKFTIWCRCFCLCAELK